MILIILLIKISFEKNEVNEEIDNVALIQSISISVFYFAFLVVYIIIFRFLTTRLSRKYPKFYEKERRNIIITNSLIISSMLFRIILTICYSIKTFNDAMKLSFRDATWFYPIV
jgi:hypothetical protein